MLEELIDLKVQQHLGPSPGLPPEVARLLHEKRDHDRHRLGEVKAQLIEALESD